MPLRKKKLLAAGLTCTVLLIAAGCSRQQLVDHRPRRERWRGSKTFTIGLLTDATGPGASEAATSVEGVKAAVGVAATMGYKIKYIVSDTGTSPSQALSGAQQLVEQDHVFAVIGVSALLFEAAPFLTTNEHSRGRRCLRLVRVVAAQELQHVLGHRQPGLHQGVHHDRPVPEEPGGDQPRVGGLLGVTELGRRGQGVFGLGPSPGHQDRVPQRQLPVRQHQRGPGGAGHEERRGRRPGGRHRAEHGVRPGRRPQPARRAPQGDRSSHRWWWRPDQLGTGGHPGGAGG